MRLIMLLLHLYSFFYNFSENDIKDILNLAEESRLSVIPLVQTFGHLEVFICVKYFSMVVCHLSFIPLVAQNESRLYGKFGCVGGLYT